MTRQRAQLEAETLRVLEDALPPSRRLNDLGGEVTGLDHAAERGWLTAAERRRISELRAELASGMARMEQLRLVARSDESHAAFCRRMARRFVEAERHTRGVDARRFHNALASDAIAAWRAEAEGGDATTAFSWLLLSISDIWASAFLDVGPPELDAAPESDSGR